MAVALARTFDQATGRSHPRCTAICGPSWSSSSALLVGLALIPTVLAAVIVVVVLA